MLRKILACVVVGIALAVQAWRPAAVTDFASEREWIRTRVAALDLTSEERRWEEIGWLSDVAQAYHLSLQQGRPMLVFVGAGDLDGRC